MACVMCGTEPVKKCGKCSSASYCSPECQRADWPTHKLLCSNMAQLGPAPSIGEVRVIVFEPHEARPKLAWVSCTVYGGADGKTLLGEGFAGSTFMQFNPRRNTILGYEIRLQYRDNFLHDRSPPNKGLQALGAAHPWGGPVVVSKQFANEIAGNISLADFRHLVDFVKMYPDGYNPMKMLSSPSGSPTAVMLYCTGSAEKYGTRVARVTNGLEETHPIFRGAGSRSAISALLGMPLLLMQRPAQDSGGFQEQRGVFLMMDINLDHENFGWAPMQWCNGLYDIILVSADRGLLEIEQVALMVYYVQKVFLVSFEDAGDDKAARRAALSCLTEKKNMELYRQAALNDEKAWRAGRKP